MNIPKSAKDWTVTAFVTIILGVAADAVWAGITRLATVRIDPPVLPHIRLAPLAQLLYYIFVAMIGVLIGRNLGRIKVTAEEVSGRKLFIPKQSTSFVLEVDGTRPLDSEGADWKFYITNCTTKLVRSVQLRDIRSEIPAYVLAFREVPVMRAGQKVELSYNVSARREDEKYSDQKPTLWDFATCHAGERGHSYIWYDAYIEYREADNESVRDGGVVGICFDVDHKILSTEGAELYRQTNYNTMLGRLSL